MEIMYKVTISVKVVSHISYANHVCGLRGIQRFVCVLYSSKQFSSREDIKSVILNDKYCSVLLCLLTVISSRIPDYGKVDNIFRMFKFAYTWLSGYINVGGLTKIQLLLNELIMDLII
jgi:hypothetical protein